MILFCLKSFAQNLCRVGDDHKGAGIDLVNGLLQHIELGSFGYAHNHRLILARVPTFAVDDLIENPVNPFTGKEINNDEKYAHDQYVIHSWEYDIAINNGNTFIPSKWYRVKDNIWDLNNWTLLEEVTTLPEECK